MRTWVRCVIVKYCNFTIKLFQTILCQVDKEAMAEYQRARDKEEDTSVTSLVEAAPRIKVQSLFG